MHRAASHAGRTDRPERRRELSAQTAYLETDAIGVFPTIALLIVFALAVMGIVAHGAFA